MRVAALDDLAVEFEHQPQNSVRGRVLRPEVQVEIADLLFARPAYLRSLGRPWVPSFQFCQAGGIRPSVPGNEVVLRRQPITGGEALFGGHVERRSPMHDPRPGRRQIVYSQMFAKSPRTASPLEKLLVESEFEARADRPTQPRDVARVVRTPGDLAFLAPERPAQNARRPGPASALPRGRDARRSSAHGTRAAPRGRAGDRRSAPPRRAGTWPSAGPGTGEHRPV